MANDMREQYILYGKLFLINSKCTHTHIFRQKEEDRNIQTYMNDPG